MRWYEGDIAQAVSMSKSKNAIFVVYVEGKDEKSKNLTSLINENDISTKLESDTFVAIKVEAGSVPHNQFAAIYKSVPVPSLFFIGKSGKPISIIVDSTSANDLSAQINSVIETHTGTTPTNSQTEVTEKTTPDVSSPVQVTSTANVADTSQNTNPSKELINSEKNYAEATASVVEETEKPSNIECENGICYKISDTTTSSDTKSKPSEPPSVSESKESVEDKKELSKEEKVERAKELVEIKREAKKKEEEEAERLKELERRKAGQDVQKLRRWQQDQELKTVMEERQRAKNEEKAARDRILAQIAQDKADRAVRFGTSPPLQHHPEVVNRSSPPPTNQNITRLQFKLPDGSSRTQNFQNLDTLQDVTNFVTQNLNLPFRNFSLSTTFPRREFTSQEFEQTLRDLELCPNAVILILPAHSTSAVVSSEGGGFMSLIWFILSPILGVYGYFRNLIFGQAEDNTPRPPERNKRSNEDSSNQPQQ